MFVCILHTFIKLRRKFIYVYRIHCDVRKFLKILWAFGELVKWHFFFALHFILFIYFIHQPILWIVHPSIHSSINPYKNNENKWNSGKKKKENFEFGLFEFCFSIKLIKCIIENIILLSPSHMHQLICVSFLWYILLMSKEWTTTITK